MFNAWRAHWAAYVNAALAWAGMPERVSHLSLKAQGIEREAEAIPQTGGMGEGTARPARRLAVEQPVAQLSNTSRRAASCLLFGTCSRKPDIATPSQILIKYVKKIRLFGPASKRKRLRCLV